MFNTKAHHGAMLKPRPVRAVADADQYRSYERADESIKPRVLGRTIKPAPGFEDLPTSQQAPSEGTLPTIWTQETNFGHQIERQPAPVSPPMELRPAPAPPSVQPRPAPEPPQVPALPTPTPMPFAPAPQPMPTYTPRTPPAPYEPVVPEGEAAPPPGGPIMNGAAPVVNGQPGLVNGQPGLVNGGVAFPGRAEGPAMPVTAQLAVPVWQQPWFWGLAAAGLAGAGVLYYLSQKREA
jgi:hypothetical protein